jgi:hypothetical protein
VVNLSLVVCDLFIYLLNLLLKMALAFLKDLLRLKSIGIIVIGTVSGGVVQFYCLKYIKNHPEHFETENGVLKEIEPGVKNKNRNPKFRGFFMRGGNLVVVPMIYLIAFLAQHGWLVGFFATTLSIIPTKELSIYIREALPQNLPELERKKFILVDGEKVYLDLCDQNIEYLFVILKDPAIPYKEKTKLARSILTKHLNLKTADGRVSFVLCMVFVLYILSTHNISSYHILLKNLIEAIKKGKISKIVGRAIIRKLRKKGLPIDPELLEVVRS